MALVARMPPGDADVSCALFDDSGHAAGERRGRAKGLVGRRARELDAKLLDDLYVYVTLLRVLPDWHGCRQRQPFQRFLLEQHELLQIQCSQQ